MNNKTKNMVKLNSKRLLALGMIALNISPIFMKGLNTTVHADSKNDSTTTTSGTTSEGLKVVPSSNKTVTDAAEAAKKQGANVTQKETKHVVVDAKDVENAQKEIDAENTKTIASLKDASSDEKEQDDKYAKDQATFEKEFAEWQEYMKHPTMQNNTDWTDDQLYDFAGIDFASLTYVGLTSGKSSVDLGSTTKMTKTQYDDLASVFTDKNWGKNHNLEDSKHVMAVIKKGDVIKYKKAFVNPETKKLVDVYVHVDDLVINNNKPAYADVRKDGLGVNLYTPNTATWSLSYHDSETGKAVTLKHAIEPVGDVDGGQKISFKEDAAKTLYGSKDKADDKNTFESKNIKEYGDPNDPTFEVWRRADNSSGVTFNWQPEPGSQAATTWRADDYWQFGGITFGFDLKTPPTPPTKPTPIKTDYQLTDLMVKPSNYKDVTADGKTKSIDKQKVKVGDVVNYPLSDSKLPADRAGDIQSYVLTDTLDPGLKLTDENIEAAKKAMGDDWKLDVEGQKVTITATDALLKKMNADKTKEFEVPTPKLPTTIAKGSVTIKNTFNTDIKTSTDGSLDVKSNEVQNTTDKLAGLIQKRLVVGDKLETKATIKDFLEKKAGLTFALFNREDTEGKTHFIKDNSEVMKLLDIKADQIQVLDEKTDDDQLDQDLTDNKYSEDITKDFDIKVAEDGGITITDKDNKYAGHDYKVVIKDAKLKDSVDLSKLPKDMITVDKDGTIHFNAENIAENEDGKSNSVSFNDDKKGDEKSTPAETVTKEAVVKMAQTGHSNSVFDKIINYFMGK